MAEEEERKPENIHDDVKEEELDASIEADIRQAEPQDPDAMNLDQSANQELDADLSGFAARIPAKKDASLREFLGKMDEYAPIVSLTFLCNIAPSYAQFPSSRVK